MIHVGAPAGRQPCGRLAVVMGDRPAHPLTPFVDALAIPPRRLVTASTATDSEASRNGCTPWAAPWTSRPRPTAGSGWPFTCRCRENGTLATLLPSEAMGTRSDLQLALRASDAAAELALTHFEVGVSSSTKSDGTPVTEADLAVEHMLRQILGAEAPDDALFGEDPGTRSPA